MAGKQHWFRDRINVLNVILVTFATVGVIVMGISIAITVGSVIKHHGVMPTNPRPTVSVTPPERDYSNVKITETRNYTFTRAKDLKAFKQAGFGTVTISKGHRLRIASSPAAKKSVSITVTVDGGSTVSFDDEQSGEIGIDSANFFIDGWSGTTTSGNSKGSAKYQVYTLSPGKHTLTWQFFTDSTVNLPTDAYYIDNIKITNVFTKAYLTG